MDRVRSFELQLPRRVLSRAQRRHFVPCELQSSKSQPTPACPCNLPPRTLHENRITDDGMGERHGIHAQMYGQSSIVQMCQDHILRTIVRGLLETES